MCSKALGKPTTPTTEREWAAVFHSWYSSEQKNNNNVLAWTNQWPHCYIFARSTSLPCNWSLPLKKTSVSHGRVPFSHGLSSIIWSGAATCQCSLSFLPFCSSTLFNGCAFPQRHLQSVVPPPLQSLGMVIVVQHARTLLPHCTEAFPPELSCLMTHKVTHGTNWWFVASYRSDSFLIQCQDGNMNPNWHLVPNPVFPFKKKRQSWSHANIHTHEHEMIFWAFQLLLSFASSVRLSEECLEHLDTGCLCWWPHSWERVWWSFLILCPRLFREFVPLTVSNLVTWSIFIILPGFSNPGPQKHQYPSLNLSAQTANSFAWPRHSSCTSWLSQLGDGVWTCSQNDNVHKTFRFVTSHQDTRASQCQSTDPLSGHASNSLFKSQMIVPFIIFQAFSWTFSLAVAEQLVLCFARPAIKMFRISCVPMKTYNPVWKIHHVAVLTGKFVKFQFPNVFLRLFLLSEWPNSE